MICKYFVNNIFKRARANFLRIVKWFQILLYSTINLDGGPCGVMAKAMACGIVVSEFILQSRNYVHFRANTLGKGMNPLILPAMG